MRTRIVAIPAIAAVTIALAGCSTSSASDSSSSDRIRVVASTNVYGSIVKQIGGSHVDVTSILNNPSQDPHSFEADARTQLAVSKADLLIENGGGYDDYMQSLADSTKSTARIVNVVHLSGLDNDDGAAFNEHVFYRYPTMIRFVHTITKRLTAEDSAEKSTFTTNAAGIVAKLKNLESQTVTLKQSYAGVKVAYTEPVPGYLFDAIGLRNETPEAFSEAIEEGDDVPPQALNNTLKLFSSHTVKILAYNDQTSSPETEQVKSAAKSASVPIVAVTETLPTGKNYVSWQQANINALRAALAK